MADIVKFLNARIDEDEVVAQNLLRDLNAQIEAEGYDPSELRAVRAIRMLEAQLWAYFDGQTRWRNFARGQQIGYLANPAHALAEAKAKRRIVEAYLAREDRDAEAPSSYRAGAAEALEDALRLLALPYANHENFDPDWAV